MSDNIQIAIFTYCGVPRGHSLSIYARFSAKTRTSLYIGDHCYFQTRHNNLFFFFYHYHLFLGKGKEKLARKARVNTGRVYGNVLMTPGHPTILLKSNKFNMAAVSVKRSIVLEYTHEVISVESERKLLKKPWQPMSDPCEIKFLVM